MPERENLIDFYYTTLHKEKNPGLHLARFFWELLSIEPNKGDISIFNKLIKIYGRDRVFYALIDLAEAPNLDINKYYGLLVWFIKRNIEQKEKIDGMNSYIDLNEEIKKLRKQLTELKKEVYTVTSPFEEE